VNSSSTQQRRKFSRNIGKNIKLKVHLPKGKTDSLLDSPSSIKFKPIRTTPGKPKGHGRNRSASDGTVLLPAGHTLSAHHPAWSLPHLLEIFGPLIFPIHRAALLRKRILITAHAPVQETCDFGISTSFPCPLLS